MVDETSHTEQSPDQEDNSRRNFLIGAVLFMAVLMGVFFLWLRPQIMKMHVHGGASRFVTLDAVKLVNAERAALPGLTKNNSIDSGLALMDIGKRMQPTIEQVAGPDTVVIVKQAVVLGDLPDITDAVIKALNLPVDAPTVDVSKYLEQAPTTDALSGAAALWEQRQKAMADAHKNEDAKRANDAVNQNIP